MNNLKITDFEIYTTLGNFLKQQFLLKIGTGTFGRVRQARLKGDPINKVYALKMLKKTEIVRLNQVEHIKSEKRIL